MNAEDLIWPDQKTMERASQTALDKVFEAVRKLPTIELQSLIMRLDGTPDDLLLNYANEWLNIALDIRYPLVCGKSVESDQNKETR